jgi:hypothetical protein
LLLDPLAQLRRHVHLHELPARAQGELRSGTGAGEHRRIGRAGARLGPLRHHGLHLERTAHVYPLHEQQQLGLAQLAGAQAGGQPRQVEGDQRVGLLAHLHGRGAAEDGGGLLGLHMAVGQQRGLVGGAGQRNEGGAQGHRLREAANLGMVGGHAGLLPEGGGWNRGLRACSRIRAGRRRPGNGAGRVPGIACRDTIAAVL